ncbi:MAG: type II secretion system GspH family protein [Scytolyngbya sp. HA4215-MV1]|nr:type II secretion system GspH family protein [Scytolyngbya sp. HA4215-MV1]
MIRKTSSNPAAGFTLLEAIVVMVIIGILFAIAAPGWVTFLRRQRVGTVRNQAAQVIRQAQLEARKTRSSRILQFNYALNSANDPARATIGSTVAAVGGGCPTLATGSLNVQTLGQGTVSKGQVRLATFANGAAYDSIVFDERGTIRCIRNSASGTVLSADNLGSGFMVTAYTVNGTTANTQRCVVVSTILGGTYVDEGPVNGTRGCRTN